MHKSNAVHSLGHLESWWCFAPASPSPFIKSFYFYWEPTLLFSSCHFPCPPFLVFFPSSSFLQRARSAVQDWKLDKISGATFFFLTREGQQVQGVSKDLRESNCGTNLRNWLSGLNGKQTPRESRFPITPLDNGHIFFYFSLQSQEIHF